MKKILLIIITVSFIASVTELHQLLKLPMALSHFKQHQKEDKNISLAGFLRLHYLPGHPDDKDESEDQQLPFKNQEAVYHIDVLTGHQLPFTNFELATLVIPKNTYHTEGKLIQQSRGIFRPPKA